MGFQFFQLGAQYFFFSFLKLCKTSFFTVNFVQQNIFMIDRNWRRFERKIRNPIKETVM